MNGSQQQPHKPTLHSSSLITSKTQQNEPSLLRHRITHGAKAAAYFGSAFAASVTPFLIVDCLPSTEKKYLIGRYGYLAVEGVICCCYITIAAPVYRYAMLPFLEKSEKHILSLLTYKKSAVMNRED